MKRRPLHVSSIAQTLLSTTPWASPISRTTFSFKSVATFDAFLGHAIQSPPRSASAFSSRAKDFARSAASLVKLTITSWLAAPPTSLENFTPAGSG